MSERFRPIVFVGNLSKEQLKICLTCPVTGISCNEPHANPCITCKPAQLESSLGKIPTYADARKLDINMYSIPDSCPNKYVGLSSHKIR